VRAWEAGEKAVRRGHADGGKGEGRREVEDEHDRWAPSVDEWERGGREVGWRGTMDRRKNRMDRREKYRPSWAMRTE
jgi:hypothetical protein